MSATPRAAIGRRLDADMAGLDTFSQRTRADSRRSLLSIVHPALQPAASAGAARCRPACQHGTAKQAGRGWRRASRTSLYLRLQPHDLSRDTGARPAVIVVPLDSLAHGDIIDRIQTMGALGSAWYNLAISAPVAPPGTSTLTRRK